MPVITERKVSGSFGIPAWIKPSREGGGGGPDTSFPISPREIATWFLMTGIAMLFAGLSSAYIVLRGVPSWENIPLPSLVWGKTLILVVSSVTFEMARRSVKRNRIAALKQWLGVTAILGIAFVAGQIEAWRQLSAARYHLISTMHSSFFYVLSGIHAVHILGGLIGLTVVIVKTWYGRLSSLSFEPLRMCATYWHFMAGVWLYLLLLLVLA